MTEDRAEALSSSLSTRILGRPLRHYPIALTTESLALAWARTEDAPEGATVVADQELTPRQRKGPPWIGFGSDGLYLSVVLRPGLPPEGEQLLWLLASLGAAEGIERLAGAPTTVKWPDDVLIDGRKIAGVKVETQLGPARIVSSVVTLRINVNVDADTFPADLRERASSIALAAGSKLAIGDALDATLKGIEARYDDDAEVLLEAYRERCETLGRSVRALLLPRGEAVGMASAIDRYGSLIVGEGAQAGPVRIGTLKRLEAL